MMSLFKNNEPDIPAMIQAEKTRTKSFNVLDGGASLQHGPLEMSPNIKQTKTVNNSLEIGQEEAKSIAAEKKPSSKHAAYRK